MTISNNIDFDEDLVDSGHLGSRRRAREIALQGLYAAEMTDNSLEEIFKVLREYHGPEESAFDFAWKIVEETVNARDELDTFIKDRAANWDFGRIAIIDRIILRIAICEFLHFWDIPPKVSIDEAIELSKNFSTERSSRFVNGILDAILSDFKSKNLIIKSGRGLKEKSTKAKPGSDANDTLK